MRRRPAFILPAAIIGGALLEVEPVFTLVVVAGALVWYRDALVNGLGRAFETARMPGPNGAIQQPAWHPGRNLLRVLVWCAALGCVAIAASTII